MLLDLACDDATHRTISSSSVLCVSENLILKASPPAHLSMLLSRGWRTRIQVASESWMIGATSHDDNSLVSQQGEGDSSTAHALLKKTDIRVSRQSTR